MSSEKEQFVFSTASLHESRTNDLRGEAQPLLNDFLRLLEMCVSKMIRMKGGISDHHCTDDLIAP